MAASTTTRDDAQQTLIDTYAALLDSVMHMHELADNDQWAELIDQRTHYVLLVEKLRELDTSVTLESSAQQRKAELLEAILEQDVEIRRQLIARRDELGRLINVSQRQRSLHRAYAPQQASDNAFGDNNDQAPRSS
ncbi:flagellar protein FliT [Halomonas sp. SH5A2]|uniref:flagellar protein FliT n=1 Tax=Halomonas sp. SH5A2 TaxID=2749040 RepID=UPI001641AC58|nr:flagellar protein FliT [Halomonas sp. SH5A2]QNI01530.1 flagellar protein FliT [Halomonas sp. SH5A2]